MTTRNTPCPTCGKTHVSTGPLCRRCAGAAANTLELTGGQWRYDPRSHVRRWVRDLVAQTFDEGALHSCQDSCPQTPQLGCDCATNRGRIGATPEEAATSIRGLTESTPASARTQGARMVNTKYRAVLR